MTTLTLQPQTLPLVKSVLELKRHALEFGLRRYGERLEALEQRYGFDSAAFARKFSAGELGDEAEWFEWQFLWESYQETQRQLDLLRTISL